MDRGTIMKLPKGEIIERVHQMKLVRCWGPFVEMVPTMRLPQGKLKCGHQVRLVRCWPPWTGGPP